MTHAKDWHSFRRCPALALWIISLNSLTGSLFGGEVWPQFRGPAGDGHAAGVAAPVRWSETENVAWKSPIPGLGWSSPAIVGDRMFLTTAVPVTSGIAGTAADEEAHSLELLCLDLRNGELLFRKPLFEQRGPVQIHKKNSHASPSPLVADGRVYAHFGPHGTACTTLDGDVVWTRSLPYEPQHGNGGSPVHAGDVLVICCDGKDVQYVVGLELTTGEVRWKTERATTPQKGFSFGTPLWLPGQISGETRDQVICPGSDAVFSYDPRNGDTLWRFDYPGGYSVIPKPVYGHGTVYICSGYDKPVLYAVRPDGTGNVTETHLVWKLERGIPHTPSLLLEGSELYLVTDRGVAACLDAATGKEHWRERLGGNFSASPLLAGGLVYFQDENGVATVIRASTTFEQICRNQIGNGERTFASYAVADGRFYIRSEQAVYAVVGGK